MKVDSIARFLVFLALALPAICWGALPQGTAFTYQGKLTDSGGNPLSGSYDMRLKLFDDDDAGSQVGGTVSLSGVIVAGGLFTVQLDFGQVWNGQRRWLETTIGAETLSPRVEITGAPYALGLAPSITGSINNLASANANPTVVGSALMSWNAYSVAVSGRYAYALLADSTLKVIDVSNPAMPQGVGFVTTAAGPRCIAVSGRYGYVVSTGAPRFQVIDLSDASAPVVAGSFDTGSPARSVAVAGRYAYVASDQYYVRVIDVSDPPNPSLVGSVSTGRGNYSGAVAGRYVYTTGLSYDEELQVVDVSNPASPSIVGSVVAGGGWSLAVSGRYAYVPDPFAGCMKVVDVTGIETTALNSHCRSADQVIVPVDQTRLYG